MRAKPYTLDPTNKSHCKYCRGPVVLLQPETPAHRLPSFFICFMCKTVSRIGVGEVRSYLADSINAAIKKAAGR